MVEGAPHKLEERSTCHCAGVRPCPVKEQREGGAVGEARPRRRILRTGVGFPFSLWSSEERKEERRRKEGAGPLSDS